MENLGRMIASKLKSEVERKKLLYFHGFYKWNVSELNSKGHLDGFITLGEGVMMVIMMMVMVAVATSY